MKIAFSQSGQMIVEYVLYTVVITAIALLLSSQFRDNELLGAMVERPWGTMAGMVQNGTWAPPQESMTSHPSYATRTATMKGEPLE